MIHSQLDFLNYVPGRFSYLMGNSWVPELWAFLADAQTVDAMLASVQSGKPAIHSILATIEDRFSEQLASPAFPVDDVGVFINNIIKHIMTVLGYEHSACGICAGRFIRASGVYQKKG